MKSGDVITSLNGERIRSLGELREKLAAKREDKTVKLSVLRNKSEMATGYSTLYGDSAGGFAVIKDVPKTLVYELCLHRNKIAGFDLVPEPILTKAPSAELRPDQRDEESLPPYPVLDPVIAGYVEGDRSADDLIAEGYDPAVVGRVVELVDRAEQRVFEIAEGSFREDLFHRLSVVPIRVPSLSERREDIGELIDFFMDQVSSTTGLPKRKIGADATAAIVKAGGKVA